MWTRIIDSTFFSIMYPVTLIISVIIGYYWANRFYTRKNKEWKASGIESAVIGLFGLMLSFTFLSSGNAMRERNNLVHKLADAAADMRRESLFVSDTLKSYSKEFLLRYLNAQIDFNSEIHTDKDDFIRDVSTINGIYLTRLTDYSKISPAHMQDVRLILSSFNQLNTFFYRIMYSYEERTPRLIILLIIISSWFIGMLIGFMNGFYKARHYLVPVIFIILVALSVQTIRDLDNPTKGSIKPDYNNFKQQRDILLQSTR